MNYYTCMQNSINYIEKSITNKINLNEVANIGCFSLYHFHRIFKAMIGDSLKEYIRKRRLTLASYELLHTDARIIEIALKYQFGSQESFTRAFKKVYDKTPAKYRKDNKNITYYHRNKMDINNMKHLTTNVEIVNLSMINKLKVVGVEYVEKYNRNTFNNMLKDFTSRKGLIKNLINPNQVIGICHCDVSEFDPEKSTVEYMFCMEVSDFEDIPQGMVTRVLPRRQYLVFTHKASREIIGETEDYIYGSFLPKSGYDLLGDEDLTIFDYRYDNETNIYVPIKDIDRCYIIS